MKKPEIDQVEVDMVPLIDIISLLLMFLIIVGDTTASSNIAQLKLPKADQAKTEEQWKMSTAGRIVIQIKPSNLDDEEAGGYYAVFNTVTGPVKDDGPAGEERLKKALKEFVDKAQEDAQRKGETLKDKDGTWKIPVKLRVARYCPITDVQKRLSTIAGMNLVNIQYAVSKDEKKKK